VEITLNGEERSLEAAKTLGDLLTEIGVPGEGTGIAIAVNGTVVRRSTWSECTLREGDNIEIIHAVQGG